MVWIARVFGALLLVLAGAAMAGETRGTAEAAQAMVARAIAAYDAQGKAAFAAMNAPSTDFATAISMYSWPGPTTGRWRMASMPAGSAAISPRRSIPPARPSARRWVEKADEKGVWIDYTWRDPLTGKDTQKSSWVIRHDGYIFGCGIYKP